MITAVVASATISINSGLTIAHSGDSCDSHQSSGLSHQAFKKAEAAGTPIGNAVKNTAPGVSPVLCERKRAKTEVGWTANVQLDIKLVLLVRQFARFAGQLKRRGGKWLADMITAVVASATISINSGMTVRASH